MSNDDKHKKGGVVPLSSSPLGNSTTKKRSGGGEEEDNEELGTKKSTEQLSVSLIANKEEQAETLQKAAVANSNSSKQTYATTAPEDEDDGVHYESCEDGKDPSSVSSQGDDKGGHSQDDDAGNRCDDDDTASVNSSSSTKNQVNVEDKEGEYECNEEEDESTSILSAANKESTGETRSTSVTLQPDDVFCPLSLEGKEISTKMLHDISTSQVTRRFVDKYIAPHRSRFKTLSLTSRFDLARQIEAEVTANGVRLLYLKRNGGFRHCTHEEAHQQIIRFLNDDDRDRDVAQPLSNRRVGSQSKIAPTTATTVSKTKDKDPKSVDPNSEEAYLRARAAVIARLSKSDQEILESSITHATNPVRAGAYSSLDGRPVAASRISTLPSLPSHGAAGLTPPSLGELGIGVSMNRGGLIVGPPRPNDVIIGQEAIIYGQDGNALLQNLVRANISEESASVEMTTLKASAILCRMERVGCRFLVKESETRSFWYQLTETETLDLIFQCLVEEEKKARFMRTLREREHFGRGGLLPNRPPTVGGLSFLPSTGLAFTSPTSIGVSTSHLPQHGFLASSQQARENPESITGPQIIKKRPIEHTEGSNGVSGNAVELPKRSKENKKKLKRLPEESKVGKSMDLGRRGSDGPAKTKEKDIEQSKSRTPDGGKGDADRIKDNVSTDSEKSTTDDCPPAKASTTEANSILGTNDASTILRGPISIGKHDVILGRGRGNFQNPGNRSLINTFRNSKQAYNDASKKGKSQIARDIVKRIRDKGGRFMKKLSNNTWEMIGDDEAFRKVSHGIRDLRDSERRLELFQNDSELSDSDEEGSGNDSALLGKSRGDVPNGSDDSTQGIIRPHDRDVVCGRGKALNRHPGNRRMTRIVRKYKNLYIRATDQDEKAHIANRVLDTVQSNGARFLKCDASGQWQELSYKVALKKVFHSIRDSLYNDDVQSGKESEKSDDDEDGDEVEPSSSSRRPSSTSIEALKSSNAKKDKPAGMYKQSIGADALSGLGQDAVITTAQRQQLDLHRLNIEREANLRLGLGAGHGSMMQYPATVTGQYGAAAATQMSILNSARGFGALSGGTGFPLVMQHGGQLIPTQSNLTPEQLRLMMLSRYGR